MNQYLTKREQQILDYITRQIDQAGLSPSLEEIAAEFEIPSQIRVTRYLNGLEGKGWILCLSNEAGGISLVENDRNYRLSICGEVDDERVSFKKSIS